MNGDNGGLSTFYAEPIGRKWFAYGGDIEVRAVREATLSDDLSEIAERRFRSIRVQLGKDAKPVDLNRESAAYLRNALTTALDRTADDPTGYGGDQ